MTKMSKVKDYKYTECGLDNVILKDMPYQEDDDGNIIFRIPAVNLLHAVIAFGIVMSESGMLPDELKFIRTELGLTQSELGERVQKDGQTVGRWERGDNPIDQTAEVVIRMMIIEHLEGIGFFNLIDVDESEMRVENLSRKCIPSTRNDPIKISPDGNKGYRLVA
ncbi:helix-turn-helix domain-containing protein [Litorimonas sp.]|uniref:helix-turn-helix domain-containing protein n=1 Tax=Litorimonas sp. TaxID=1892381 RepID=UPI003A85EE01